MGPSWKGFTWGTVVTKDFLIKWLDYSNPVFEKPNGFLTGIYSDRDGTYSTDCFVLY